MLLVITSLRGGHTDTHILWTRTISRNRDAPACSQRAPGLKSLVMYCILSVYSIGVLLSRHTVVCQQPRKPCDSQVCYLQEPLTRHFQPLISL